MSGYDFLPNISVALGLTGVISNPCSDSYFGTKCAALPEFFDMPTTATFFNENTCLISSSVWESLSMDFIAEISFYNF